MVKVALLLLVTAALAILVLSNLSPVALTILGTKTLALPLGVWVVGAIGAGALTTILISGLFQLARPAGVPAARRASSTERFGASSFRSPWGTASKPSQATASRPGYASSYASDTAKATASNRRNDDWETSQQAKAAWEDWGDYRDGQDLTDRQFDRQSQVQPNIRDTEDDDWANWEGYEELERDRFNQRSGSRFDNDELDDLDDLEPDAAGNMRNERTSGSPDRTDFEVKREPETRQQSGSVYSFSYRRSDDEPASTPPPARPGEVYDADYRVIAPPYHPDPEEISSPVDRSSEIRDSSFAGNSLDRSNFDDSGFDDSGFNSSSNDDEDWGLDDDVPDDRPRR